MQHIYNRPALPFHEKGFWLLLGFQRVEVGMGQRLLLDKVLHTHNRKVYGDHLAHSEKWDLCNANPTTTTLDSLLFSFASFCKGKKSFWVVTMLGF